MIINESGGGSLSRTARGTIASFNARDNSPLKSLVVDIDPVQAGTGDPSPENVRPISGWTGVKVQRTEKNLLRNKATSKTVSGVTFTVNADGSITINGVAEQTISYSINSNISLPSGTYMLNGFPSGYGSCRLQWEIQIPGEDRIYGSDNGSGTTVSWEGEPSENNVFIIIFTGHQFENVTVYPMIRLSTEADNTYKPYQGDIYDISFPDEAGTVYGGTLDVTNGVLTVDKQGYDMGTLNWVRQAGSINPDVYLFWAQAPIASTVAANQGLGISTMFATVTANLVFAGQAPDNTIGIAGRDVNIRCDSYTDASAFKAAVSGQLAVVPVSPITYQLTPTEVNTLLGVNNIWADTGDCEVVYWTNPEIIHVINSSGLNLKVVGGTTQPTNPAENTVWVNTDVDINGYAFSSAAPTNPVAGMVWFDTGTSSNTAINVDKKNTVMLYPLDCKQYVSGAWVSKTAKVYLNGAWVELWDGTIFDNGNEYTVITGGFSGEGSFQQITTNKNGYLGVLAGYGSTGAVLTNSAIDLTDFSTLTAVVNGDGSNTKRFGITPTRGTSFSANVSISSNEDKTVSIDVSTCNGLYYIGILSNSNNWAYAKYIKLER